MKKYVKLKVQSTVWRFDDFSGTWILRESKLVLIIKNCHYNSNEFQAASKLISRKVLI